MNISSKLISALRILLLYIIFRKMDSDTSTSLITTYSVDLSIENYIKRNKKERQKNEENIQDRRKRIFEDYLTNHLKEWVHDLNGLHIYTFTEKKIKFGFNPSEVAHVSKSIKFICILKYTGKYWLLGKNTIPSNWLLRINDLFTKGKSVKDEFVLPMVEEIHSIFLEWSKEHEEFRRRKIQKYRDGAIDFLELDSEDEELHLSVEEREEIREKRKRILQRMIPPRRKKRRTVKKPDLNTFVPFPNILTDSD